MYCTCVKHFAHHLFQQFRFNKRKNWDTNINTNNTRRQSEPTIKIYCTQRFYASVNSMEYLSSKAKTSTDCQLHRTHTLRIVYTMQMALPFHHRKVILNHITNSIHNHSILFSVVVFVVLFFSSPSLLYKYNAIESTVPLWTLL